MTIDRAGSFEVTIRDLYDDMRQSNAILSKGIDELKTTMSDMRTEIAVNNHWRQRVEAGQSDIEVRLRKLEKWRYSVPGAIIMSMGSTAVAVADIMTVWRPHG